MGTIIRRSNGRYQVKIRRLGYQASQTFATMDAARRWDREREHEIDIGLHAGPPRLDLRKFTFGSLVERWLAEVLPNRASASYEGPEVRWLLNQKISGKSLAYLDKSDFQILLAEMKEIRKPSGQPLKPDTIIRKWSVFRTVINHIRNEWKFDHWAHPMDGIKLPQPSPHRQRRWEPTDIRRLIAGWHRSKRKLIVSDDGSIRWVPYPNKKTRGGSKCKYMPLVVRVSWETGIRRKEMLAIRVDDLRLTERKLYLRETTTKNRTGRWVPLTSRAVNLIQRALRQPNRKADEPFVFPVSVNAFKCSLRAAMKRAKLNEDDIRHHDSRREAISRAIDAGMTLPQVLAVSGHKSMAAALRYFAPDLTNISNALDENAARRSSRNVHGDQNSGPPKKNN